MGLLPSAEWACATFTTADGISHHPNLPTEEVFTTPDYRRTQGTVRSTMPLALPGNIIRDLELRFDRGRIVEVKASTGEDYVRTQIESDDGASRLGEVALVDGTSRVGQTGHIFFNTLFDENATCHIAYGRGIAHCVEGADELDADGQLAAGVNQSSIHTAVASAAASARSNPARAARWSWRSRPKRGSAMAACANSSCFGAKWLGLSSAMRGRLRKKVTWMPYAKSFESLTHPVTYHHSLRKPAWLP